MGPGGWGGGGCLGEFCFLFLYLRLGRMGRGGARSGEMASTRFAGRQEDGIFP